MFFGNFGPFVIGPELGYLTVPYAAVRPGPAGGSLSAGADTGGGATGASPPTEGWARRGRAARKVGKAPDTRQFFRHRPPLQRLSGSAPDPWSHFWVVGR